MKIIDISVEPSTLDLAKPFVTARRTATILKMNMVKITTDTGHIGMGEATESPMVTGDTIESVKHAIIRYISKDLIGRNISDLQVNMEIIDKAIVGNTGAKSAVDMAIYDLWGQFYKAPLYKLLGGYKDKLKTDMTVSIGKKDQMILDAKEYVAKGFDTLKIKTGKGGLSDFQVISDIAHAVGSQVSLCIDANQGWTPKEAIRIIKGLEYEGLNIQFVEQPVHASDYTGMAFVTKNTSIPIAADESVFSIQDCTEILQQEAADIINIKLMKCGGIHNAIKILNIAESFGKSCIVGSMLESNLGATAAAHFAASQKNVKYVDLDTVYFIADKAVQGGAIYNCKDISFSIGAGLGIKKN